MLPPDKGSATLFSQLDTLWARNRFVRPPMDRRPTIYVAGFGFYPTGPAPPPDPAKAKAKARWKMVARFLRPGRETQAGEGTDLQAVSVRRHSTFNLLPVLKVGAFGGLRGMPCLSPRTR